MKPQDKPLAAAGLLSYRYRGRYGWIMIGARNNEDAFTEASRSTGDRPQPERLEIYHPEVGMYFFAVRSIYDVVDSKKMGCAKILPLGTDFKVVYFDENGDVNENLCLWTANIEDAKQFANQFGSERRVQNSAC